MNIAAFDNEIVDSNNLEEKNNVSMPVA